jgi:hypothetical protein
MRRRDRIQRRAFLRGYSAGRRLTDNQTARLEQKLSGQLSEQLAFLLQVISGGLGQHRREVVAEIDGAFVEMRKEISALRSPQGANGGSNQLIELPGPPVSRRLQ